MQSKAKTVREYLAGLPEDRREAIGAVRDVILQNLPKGYAEGMAYGMIGYHVPHSIYPDGYHCNPEQPLPFASLASQKNHMALYLMCVYSDPELEAWFREQWKKTGKKLDMGKSCIRFKKLEDVPLKVVGQVIKKVPVKKFIEFYETATQRHGKARKKAAKKTAKKVTKKVAKKTTKKSAARTSGRATAKAARKTVKKAAKKASTRASSVASRGASKKTKRKAPGRAKRS